jgi:Secretion system C-terminal sorting domain
MKTKQLIVLTLFCAFFAAFSPCYAQLYSNGERLTSSLNEKWGASSAWENYNRYTITYLTPTNVQATGEQWDGFSWNATEKIAITLNANYSYNTFITQIWDGAQAAWRNKGRTTYTYFNNDPTKTLVYKYDTANVVNNTLWDDYQRTTRTYNPNGLELSYIEERKNSATWQGRYKTNYTYNTNSLKTSQLSQSWQTGGFWGYLNKAIYYYNANSLVSLEIDSSATTATSPFTATVKRQYLYNANSLVAQELNTYYDTNTNAWYPYVSGKTTNTYTAQNLTQRISESYDTNLGSFYVSSKYTYAYNAQNLRTQGAYESYDSNLGILTLRSTETNTYNNANNRLVNTYNNLTTPTSSSRNTYTWGTVVGTENTTPTFDFSVFPNPTAEQINLTLPENAGVTVAMIISANGQIVKTQNLTNPQSAIDVQDLAAGSYQIILLQNGKSATKMFVKQ